MVRQNDHKPLNPFAAEFVPVRARYAAKDLALSNVIDKIQHKTVAGHDYLTTLPDDVLAIVLVQLTSPQDLVAIASACKRLRAVAAIVPLRLHLKRAGVEDLSRVNDGPRVHRVLRSICSTFAGIQELDLSGCLVEDVDIVQVVRKLPQLRMLQLSGCRKLTSDLISSVTKTCASCTHNLQAISLQRCFQQTGQTLTDALGAATPLNLKCIILSHLHLSEWPASSDFEALDLSQTDAAANTDNDENDGSGLSTEEDDSDDGPQFENLESRVEQWSITSSGQLNHEEISSVPPDFHSNMVCNLLRTNKLQILALHNCINLTSHGLDAIKSSCRNVEYIFLGGSTLRVLQSNKSCLHEKLSPLVCLGLMTGELPEHYVTQVAVELAAFAIEMPKLKALELTFFKGGIPDIVSSILQTYSSMYCKQRNIWLWDFNSLYSLLDVSALMKSYSSNNTATTWDSLGPSFRMAAQSTANCSSASRHTPLHMAAAEGSLRTTQALLDVGAVVDMRDRGGNTPLFIAAEVGHVEVVKELLARGSDYLVKNNAGETPLYIAALRGHGAVVQAVLRHFQWNGVPWHCPQLYSEGWTPLMAAVVGSHLGVVCQLIKAAGANKQAMVTAANRNKQTALHVAAQIGHIPILKCLLEAGAVHVLGIKDNNGKTAWQVAQKSNHMKAANVLMEYMPRTANGASAPRQHMVPHLMHPQRGHRNSSNRSPYPLQRLY